MLSLEELFCSSVKRNMNNKLMPLIDKLLIRKRSIIETITLPIEKHL
ncbi:hypothetical protein H6F56_07370 [Microcoleus sp. FACHB-672]|nr:hypothetical protein [Microcoleus sp. FACHB-672]